MQNFLRCGSDMVVRVVWVLVLSILVGKFSQYRADARPRRILMDTDVNMDDVFALFYVLKQNKSEFDLQAITINANEWSDAGHAVDHVYDILFMMDRDDIKVGVGGEGVISPNGTIFGHVGGYLPIIDQGMGTAGGCRYRQAIPVGYKGRLDINTNFGLRKAFLPQGGRKYSPLHQPTAQQVMIDAISAGPIYVFLLGAHTNLAIFLMNNPHLKENIEHIYVMGGAVRPKCPNSAGYSVKPEQCYPPGSLFPDYSNPYAEFNIFGDPFAAYMVFHSGIPITLIPLDATNTIPISETFFKAFEQNQKTYEAKYCFESLKLAHDTWYNDRFYENYFMWDSFMVGVSLSVMSNSGSRFGENEFAEMEYMNITVVTSNKPYGVLDGSNPFFDGRDIPKFHLQKNGVHSGHVQTGMCDPFCFVRNQKGRCEDGYTKEVTGPEAVRVLVATKAKQNCDCDRSLNRKFYKTFLDVINRPEQTGRFNIATQFPYYKEVMLQPDFGTRKLGKPGILVTPTGWATAATVNVVYDVLHMMRRDDIPVGLGDAFAIGQANPLFTAIGDCKYSHAIPHGSGGFLDSDTLYGLARHLPRSPRRYTAENSVKFGAPRDTDHPELRQPKALDVWTSIVKSLDPGSKITIVTNGPLTTLAQIISLKNAISMIQDVYIVGGHISHDSKERGNLFTVPRNKYGEFNMFLDPLAAKEVFDSELNITLVPLNIQRRVSSFGEIIEQLQFSNKTPEATFACRLLSRLWWLQQKHHRYNHMDMFVGEVLGAVVLARDLHYVNHTFQSESLKILATGDISRDGQIIIDRIQGKSVKVLKSVDHTKYYAHFADVLGNNTQSAAIGSFSDQKRIWTRTPHRKYHV
ncbi:nucleoside hydrolase 3-like isoform X2 [Actinidia eriantha]|uniref:nucleoside hydrolase 3-like isoform X2 n=1 Tax=Actinidia eriantha TaxID=165200 RepID=UPI00258A6F65|nr:nucleoside hydrolase 3-like isoform X2 [Actinidia eriantha]